MAVTATGGTGSYTYKYVLYNTKTGSWNVLSDFGSASEYIFSLGSSAVVELVATAKDSAGTTVSTSRVKVTVS